MAIGGGEMSRITKIWRGCKDTVKVLNSDAEVSARIDSTALGLWVPGRNDPDLIQQYQPEYRIPAFYDPNKDTVYINEPLSRELDKQLLTDIFHHELIHAIGDHSITEKEAEVTYKSGLKLQVVRGRKEYSYFKGLNEGFVQYLSNQITGKRQNPQAYRREVAIVGQLVEKIGLTVFWQAFFYDQLSPLYQQAELKLGKGSLRKIDARMNKGNYRGAWRLLAGK